MFLNYCHLWQHFYVTTHIAKVRPQTLYIQRNMPAQREMAASNKLDSSIV